MRIVVRGAGWVLLGAGLLLGSYLVYSLFWTTVETRAVQRQLLGEWTLEVGEVDGRLIGSGRTDGPPSADQPSAPPPLQDVELAAAVAAMRFERPGSSEKPVLDDPILVVEGVTVEALQRGPGRYQGSALPGQPGNFAVAGHRTTYGAPFYDLDELRDGDRVQVQDRAGSWFTYEVVEQRIVSPATISVLGPDPLGTGEPTLTLTTCAPRFSDAERLVVHATLLGG